MLAQHPKLREVEVFPVRDGANELLCLRDPLGFTDNIVTVSGGAALVLECLDGQHSLPAIQARIVAATNQQVPLATLEKFIAQLDDAHLLDSPRFAAHRDELLRQFRESPVREAAHAGVSYPAQPAEIHQAFAKHVEPPHGPGATPATAGSPPVALVVPHIDLRHGGPTFAWAYAALRGAPAVDTFVILGVAHVPTTQRFVGTKKHFQTPLGTVATDGEFMDALAAKLPFDLYADEWAHRREHSVEFQAVYLQHVCGAAPPYRIAPVLVGSFHDLLREERDPIRDKQVAAFVKALRETIRAAGRRVCVIASVDLAHVGGRFGDEFTVNDEVLRQLETDDRRLLAAVAAGDANRLIEIVYAEEDRRRVDAWPAVYTMLQALDLRQGELLHYAQNVEPDTNSVVTFASMKFW